MKRKLIKKNKLRFSYEFKLIRWQKEDGKRLVYVNCYPFYGDCHHIPARYVFATHSQGLIHDWQSISWWFGKDD